MTSRGGHCNSFMTIRGGQCNSFMTSRGGHCNSFMTIRGGHCNSFMTSRGGCGDSAELPMYDVPSSEDPLGPRGAAGAECLERPESRRPGSPGELHSYINLTLVVFL